MLPEREGFEPSEQGATPGWSRPGAAGASIAERMMAEREGFEPSEQVAPLNGLANRRTRPLCDLSVRTAGACYHGPLARPPSGKPSARVDSDVTAPHTAVHA